MNSKQTNGRIKVHTPIYGQEMTDFGAIKVITGYKTTDYHPIPRYDRLLTKEEKAENKRLKKEKAAARKLRRAERKK